MNKQVKILFGEMGAGKTYYGKILSKALSLDFLDGDSFIPDEMLDKVRRFEPLSKQCVENYVHNELIPAIIRFANYSNNGLVVSQALYSDADRKKIINILQDQGFDVEFFWIRTSIYRNIKQLFSRKNGLRWIMYWIMNKPYFERPTHKCSLLKKNIIYSY